ncbi:MAG: hypothetical protein JAY90_11175 [Candidatus Thiodiazotropha lotti]|nr:hypothetical protein [Candidatus Thiodiazotropha lotti]
MAIAGYRKPLEQLSDAPRNMHRALVPVWIRQQDPSFDNEHTDFLFTENQCTRLISGAPHDPAFP